jgi:hypothetical protein
MRNREGGPWMNDFTPTPYPDVDDDDNDGADWLNEIRANRGSKGDAK